MPDPDGPGIEINGVAHVVLRVQRFEECVAFYDRLMPLLGLRPVMHEDEFVYYVGGRTAVGVRRAEERFAGEEYDATRSGLDHLCFRARSREDVDRLHPLLVEIGADIVRAPVEGPFAPGYYSLSFRDPEGIRHEVNHVPGTGLLADGVTIDPGADTPLDGSA